MFWLTAHPTTQREKRSIMTAKYNQPCAVGKNVMSVTHVLSGASVANLRCKTFDAIGNV